MSKRYTNTQLRDMIQELVIKGVIDYDTRKKFMDTLYIKHYHCLLTPEEKIEHQKQSKLRTYYRNKLIKLYNENF